MTCIPFDCFPLLGLAVRNVQAARCSKSQQINTRKYPDALVPSCSYLFITSQPLQAAPSSASGSWSGTEAKQSITNEVTGSFWLTLSWVTLHPLIIEQCTLWNWPPKSMTIEHSCGNPWGIPHVLMGFNSWIILKLINFHNFPYETID